MIKLILEMRRHDIAMAMMCQMPARNVLAPISTHRSAVQGYHNEPPVVLLMQQLRVFILLLLD